MAAFIYYVLFEQITGLQTSQTGCAAEFRCGTTLFKRLITGKRQPGGQGNSSRKLEDITTMEDATRSKQRKVKPKSTRRRVKGRGRGKKAK